MQTYVHVHGMAILRSYIVKYWQFHWSNLTQNLKAQQHYREVHVERVGVLCSASLHPALPPRLPHSTLRAVFTYFLATLVQFSSVVQLCPTLWTPWITAHQVSLSITNSWSLLKLMSIESVIPSSHLILCHPLLLLPPIPPSIRVFSNESTLRMRWPKY